jgi:hypothetical protein
LVPLATLTSPAIYQAVIEDVFLQKAISHCGTKLVSFLETNLPATPPPPPDCIESVSKALSIASRSCPPSFLFHHLSLTSNALATSRRMRHQNKVSITEVSLLWFRSRFVGSYLRVLSRRLHGA